MLTKARQWTQVQSERHPRFLSDVTHRAPSGGRYAVLAKYARFGLTPDFLNLVETLERAGVNTIVVCNGSLPEAELAQLIAKAHRVLVRPNIGRDFGAYRAATLRLIEQGVSIERLMYFNDSVFYIPGAGLEAMVARMSETRFDVVGCFENHEIDHHIGSYALSVAGKVVQDRSFQKFWHRYRPYDLRPHAIHNGEIALSRHFKQRGRTIDVVYSTDALSRAMDAMPLPELFGLVRVMRPSFRMQPYERSLDQPLAALALAKPLAHMSAPRAFRDEESSRLTTPASTAIQRPPVLSRYREANAGSRSLRRTATPVTDTPNAPNASGADPDTPGLDPQAVQTAQAISRQALVDRLLHDISHGSQVHYGFGLFRRVMQAPLVKRDLLMRGIYLEHDCDALLDDVPTDLRRYMVRDLINRGRPLNMSRRRRFLMENGLI